MGRRDDNLILSGIFIKSTRFTKVENRSLEASLLILNRTRRSLSASSLSSGHGQGLLDRALAKQISARQAELDCNLQRFRSVIARTSTPDPEAAQQCEESCLENQVFSENSVELISPTQIPEDFSIPLQNFLDSLLLPLHLLASYHCWEYPSLKEPKLELGGLLLSPEVLVSLGPLPEQHRAQLKKLDQDLFLISWQNLHRFFALFSNLLLLRSPPMI